MGQKVNPIGLRTGIIRGWESKWYAPSKDVPALIKEDFEVRKYLFKKLGHAGISHIEIERSKAKDEKNQEKSIVKIIIYAARQTSLRQPIEDVTVVAGVDQKKVPTFLEAATKELTKRFKKEFLLTTRGIVKPERVAYIVACNIARDLENRVSFRKAQKQAISKALKAGVKGIKTKVSGRLGGQEIARTEGYSEGRVPLHTLRADVDYATSEAMTTYGKLGVKVWIYMGDVMPGMTREDLAPKLEKKPVHTNQMERSGKEGKIQRTAKPLGKGRKVSVSTEDEGGNE